MKNSINFQVLNNAASYRSSNSLVNAVLLLIILALIPVLIVAGLVAVVVMIIAAKVKTMFAINRSETARTKSFKQRNAEEFTDYEVIEEKIGK